LLRFSPVDTSQPTLAFKKTIADLTGVPIERQKVIGFKGGPLSDSGDWNIIKPASGQKLMVMGQADESRIVSVSSAADAPKFLEDLPEDQQDGALSGLPPGLVNLGNTCYMAATTQALFAVQPFREKLLALKLHASPSELSMHLAGLFQQLNTLHTPVSPTIFWGALRQHFPQFNEQRQGFFSQQDAEECWTSVLQTVGREIGSAGAGEEGRSSSRNVVEELFGLQVETTLSMIGGSEAPEIKSEKVLKLTCHINSGTNHLIEGMKESMLGNLRKFSPTLNGEADYSTVGKVTTLPSFLMVQFVRFYWKQASGTKAKILRKVSFPLKLDLMDLCADTLKANTLEPARNRLKRLQDKAAGLEPEMTEAEPIRESDTPQRTGNYELVSVVTHKGKDAEGGHYVAWCKQKDGKWWKFDDDVVTAQTDEEILKLSGGGDWHMGYYLVYQSVDA
jgi:ubiquitin carboxyl-terminal hydrolase 14